MDNGNAIQAVARAIYDALQQADPQAFMEDFTLEDPIVIDGRFHLQAYPAGVSSI